MKKFVSTLALVSVASLIAGASVASAGTVTYYTPEDGIVNTQVSDAPQSPTDGASLYTQDTTFYDFTEGEIVTVKVGTSTASADPSAVFKVRDSGDTNLAPKTSAGIAASHLN